MKNKIIVLITIIILLKHEIHFGIKEIKEKHLHSEIEDVKEILVNDAGYVTSGTNEYVRIVKRK